jgi:hypothetical protein
VSKAQERTSEAVLTSKSEVLSNLYQD